MPLPFDDAALRTRLALRRRRVLDAPELVAAAVLVPLFYRQGEPHLLFTKRSDRLRHHSGEISFPGGRVEPADATLLDAALREAHEEIGLAPSDVSVLGALDDLTTLKRHRVTPFVGVVPDGYPYRLEPAEVDHLLEVPVAAFLEPERLRVEWVPYPDGGRREVFFYDVGGQTVWGATARIVKTWLDELMAEV